MEPDDMLQTVDSVSFDRLVLEDSGRMAVEFMSYGCGYCRTIEPIVQRVASMIAAEETVLRVNIAADPELAKRYEITGTPTFVMFLNGSEVGRTEGPAPTQSAVIDAITRPFMS